MYNPDTMPDTEPDFPFMRPQGPTHGGLCNLKPEWLKIGSEALKAAHGRGYNAFNPENYKDLCEFVKKNRVQLYVEGIEGGLPGRIIGEEIAFRNKKIYQPMSFNEMARKGIITIIDGGELK